MKKNCVILMMRYPRSGKVKTRLAKDIGEKYALDFHMAFLKDTIRNLTSEDIDLILSVLKPSGDLNDLSEPFLDRIIIEQRGNDLGQRQYNSLNDAYDMGYDKAIVIAGDCPEICMDQVNEGLTGLVKNDAVIGPCNDGGYYLLGISKGKLHSDIFQAIQWGGRTVFRDLEMNLNSHVLSIHYLPPLNDIDAMADLVSLADRDPVKEASETHDLILKLVNEGVLDLGK